VVKVMLTCGEDGVGVMLGGLIRLVRSTGDLDVWEGGFSWDSSNTASSPTLHIL
jgi:ribosomal protein S5